MRAGRLAALKDLPMDIFLEVRHLQHTSPAHAVTNMPPSDRPETRTLGPPSSGSVLEAFPFSSHDAKLSPSLGRFLPERPGRATLSSLHIRATLRCRPF